MRRAGVPFCLAAAAVAMLWSAVAGCSAAKAPASSSAQLPMALIVMDPLAKELACACVRGYAQRDYHQLAAHLTRQVGQRVTVAFADDLTSAVAELSPNQEAIVVAKTSVVQCDAAAAGFKYRTLCRLTGKDGETTLTGYFVAKTSDSATRIEDIAGRRVLFGSTNADEKYTAALEAMRAAGIPIPKKIETRDACSDAALDVVDSAETPPPVGVISSYALPLLEGCGSIKKGDLKVIGQTKPVPFITVFCSDHITAAKQKRIADVLFAIRKNAKLLKALETQSGFVPCEDAPPQPQSRSDAGSWPDWRGPARDGRVPHLPARLLVPPRMVWRQPATDGGLAGISVADGRVLVAERDPTDERDVLRCLDAEDGHRVWGLDYEARGQLDYGQAPRATPVIRDGKVYWLGAFGDLHCVSLATGQVLWRRHLVKDLGGRLPTWGYCATPLLVGDRLIVNPGGTQTSLVALDAATGQTLWATPGHPAAYAAFIAATLGGRLQIVGYDKVSLGGWDASSGQRLWTLTPPAEGDFNVPTPLAVDGKLIVATENNGTRLYDFGTDGKILATPLGESAELAPDTTTPVAVRGRLFGTHLGLHCLDVAANLKCLWREEDSLFGEHASLFASDDRVLVVTLSGELVLVAADRPKFEAVSRVKLFAEGAEVYSHPAFVNDRLYLRGPASVCCFDLSGS
jgi:ABC-type phosphate/phosphonate transport system substrate-binding protein